jgi:hypothetical protein
LYLDRTEFEAEDDNAFMALKDGADWSMDARYRGNTYHLDLSDDPDDAQPFAAMRVLLSGIAVSTPQLPAVDLARHGS